MAGRSSSVAALEVSSIGCAEQAGDYSAGCYKCFSFALIAQVHLRALQALNAWRSAVEQMRHEQELLRRGVLRMTQNALWRAFGLWREECLERKRKQELVAVVFSRIQQLKIWSAFVVWQRICGFAEEQRETRARMVAVGKRINVMKVCLCAAVD